MDQVERMDDGQPDEFRFTCNGRHVVEGHKREALDLSIDLGSLGGAAQAGHSERADAAANRRLILQTAEALFAERGVPAVSMADIAAAAHVGKGTLYRRFNNKAELCLALMDQQMKDFQEERLTRMRESTAAGWPPMEQLDEFLDALVYFTDIHLPLLCEVQHAGLFEQAGHLQMPHFWLHMTISALLSSARRAGELPEALDLDYVADALLASLRADIFRFQREVRGYSLERISEGLRSITDALAS